MNIKQVLAGSLALLAASPMGTSPMAARNTTPKTKEKPNIIFFLVDDMGWVDSQVAYGDKVYPFNQRFDTPNMLRLAQRGVVMTSAYACSLSTPTRTSLMTGMNSAHLHITSFSSPNKDIPTDASGGTIGTLNENENDPFIRPDWNWNGICPVSCTEEANGLTHTVYVTPMVQLLKDAGYFTIHVGKAHWAAAGTPGASPYNMGFVVNIAGTSQGFLRSYQGMDNYGNKVELWNMNAVQNMPEYYGTDTHLTQALTNEALKTLEYPVAHHQPFYLYMAHYAVHTPISSDARFYQKYRDRGMDDGQAKYASMIEGVDKSLGEILDYLDKKGIADNTIIIFMGDNGGHSANTVKGGIAHTQNSPLREGKGSVYEGGIRVPLMFCWPGKTHEGTHIDVPVSPEDMMPTILQMAGVKDYHTVQPIDGQSMVQLITTGKGLDPDRLIVSHYPHQWRIEDQDDIDFLTAARQGDWKLVYRMHTGTLELYNLKEDIGERNNVAAEHPDIVKDLARKLSDRLREWHSEMPVVRATGALVPMPDELEK